MTDTKRPIMRRPRVTARDMLRLVDAYVRAGEAMVARPVALTADAIRRGTMKLESGLFGPASPQAVLGALAGEYVNLLAGLAGTLPAAMEGIAETLSAPPPEVLTNYDIPFAGPGPAEAGAMLALGPDGATPFPLPARIIDASQGYAAWYVGLGEAAALLPKGVADAFTPLDCGDGRGMVLLMASDVRVSDFGQYHEIALAVSVTPNEAAAEPGAFYVISFVSEIFPIEPARRIWGVEKTHSPELSTHYRRESASWHAGGFALTLPRFGVLRSDAIPLPAYALRAPDSADDLEGPVRITLTRSGEGEGTQIGGSVALTLGRKDEGCLCTAPGAPCLCAALSGLGLDKVLPAANGWTERMSGILPGATGV